MTVLSIRFKVTGRSLARALMGRACLPLLVLLSSTLVSGFYWFDWCTITCYPPFIKDETNGNCRYVVAFLV